MDYLFAGFVLLLCSETFGQPTPLTGRCGDIRAVERSAVLLDGGSIEVDGIDRCGARFAIRVDNSLARSRQADYAKISVNDVEVFRGSPEERRLFVLLDRTAKRRMRGASATKLVARIQESADQGALDTLAIVGVLQGICLRSTESKYVARCERYMS